MEVDTPSRRKRPIEEEEEYQCQKRLLSEKLHNLRISDRPSIGSIGPYSGGHLFEAQARGTHLDDENTMDDAPSPSFSARQMSLADSLAQLDAASTGSEEDDDSDVDDAPAPFLSRGKYRTGATLNSLGGGSAQAQHLHPFHRSTTSPVDEKVDDWVRTSRHRLLADVSVGAAPGLCRALTVYKPLSIFGGRESGDDDEEDDGREAGGDPTPSPRASGNGGGEGVAFSSSADSSGVSTKRTLSVTGWGSGNESGNDVQTPGIGSSEAAATAGGGRNRSHKQFIFGVGSEGRAVQTGGGSAHSAADDAAGRMEDVGESVGAGVVSSMQDLDAMDMVSPADDDSMGLLRDSPIQPALTRVGTSRGVPTPELTPEWAALARFGSSNLQQEPGEGASVPTLPTGGWGCR